MCNAVSALSSEEQLKVLGKLYAQYCARELKIILPEDFLMYAAPAMGRLSDAGRSNVLYNLAKGLSVLRSD